MLQLLPSPPPLRALRGVPLRLRGVPFRLRGVRASGLLGLLALLLICRPRALPLALPLPLPPFGRADAESGPPPDAATAAAAALAAVSYCKARRKGEGGERKGRQQSSGLND